MNLMKKYKITIGLMIYLFGVVCYCVYTYYDTKHKILDSIDAQLLNAAKAVPFILGENFHDKAKDKNAVTRQEYIEMVMRLSRYCNDIDLEYLYTWVKNGDQIVFTTSSSTTEELEEKDYGEFFEPYPEAEEQDFAAFDASKPLLLSGTSDKSKGL